MKTQLTRGFYVAMLLSIFVFTGCATYGPTPVGQYVPPAPPANHQVDQQSQQPVASTDYNAYLSGGANDPLRERAVYFPAATEETTRAFNEKLSGDDYHTTSQVQAIQSTFAGLPNDQGWTNEHQARLNALGLNSHEQAYVVSRLSEEQMFLKSDLSKHAAKVSIEQIRQSNATSREALKQMGATERSLHKLQAKQTRAITKAETANIKGQWSFLNRLTREISKVIQTSIKY